MAQVEKKQLDGTIYLEGREYYFQAVVFRQAHYGAFGRIGATRWQFGTYGALVVNPTAPDDLLGDLQEEIVRRANSEEPTAAYETAGS